MPAALIPSVLNDFKIKGAEEKVDVEQNHLKFSPSATASASPMLDMLAIRNPPRDMARVRKLSRRLLGPVISLNLGAEPR
jgi:hypothetical protein